MLDSYKPAFLFCPFTSSTQHKQLLSYHVQLKCTPAQPYNMTLHTHTYTHTPSLSIHRVLIPQSASSICIVVPHPYPTHPVLPIQELANKTVVWPLESYERVQRCRCTRLRDHLPPVVSDRRQGLSVDLCWSSWWMQLQRRQRPWLGLQHRIGRMSLTEPG